MILLLTGLAGSGKTALLRALAAAGEQVLDLEALASHRGSAFGGMGLGPQPSHAQFQRAVRAVVAFADPRLPLWVEDEGDYIGSVGLPAQLVAAMRTAPRVELIADVVARRQRIVATYRGCPLEEWLLAVDRVAPRMGRSASQVRAALLAGDVVAAVDLLLTYYDRGYANRSRPLTGPVLGTIDTGG